MKSTALLLALVALAPLAAADQDVEVGTAYVLTQNGAWGDGDCELGGDGGQSRHARAGVGLTPHDEVAVVFSQNCNTAEWSDGYDSYSDESSSGSVQVGRFADDNPGPVVQANWMDQRYDWGPFEGRTCFTSLYASGPGVSLGCLPNRERWPMAPALP